MTNVTEFECECGHVEAVPTRYEALQSYNGCAVFVCPSCGGGQECLVLPKQFFFEGEDASAKSK